MRYLRGTSNNNVMHRGEKSVVLECFLDSDYPGDLSSMRSIHDCIYIIRITNLLEIYTKSAITLSTTKAEYVVAGEVVKEILCLIGIVNEMRLGLSGDQLYCNRMLFI